ncbi:hypothetical protein [Microcoleus sp. FACHB-831]|nr:hypothetical protein [Microcoleus sp. FACHB-831]
MDRDSFPIEDGKIGGFSRNCLGAIALIVPPAYSRKSRDRHAAPFP